MTFRVLRMGMEQQAKLFHESIYDALGTLINALGGPKRVGPMLWPEKLLDASSQLARDCVNPSRKERFDPEQTLLLLKKGREIGCHDAVNYICEAAGYTAPDPVEPETELAKLLREYLELKRREGQLEPKIEEQRTKLARVA